MQLEIIRDSADFIALREEWSGLETVSPTATIFNTWGWLCPWWKVYGNGHRLFLVIARSDSRLVGILPLYIRAERVARLRHVRVLRLIGSGGDTSPDYLGAITLPGHEDGFAAAAIQLLNAHHQEWDIACMTDMSYPSGLVDALRKHRAFGSRTKTRITFGHIPIVVLDTDWPSYVAGLGATHRGQLARRRRKLAAMPAMRLTQWQDTDRLDEVFDRLKTLHVMRWKEAPAHPAFQSKTYIEFHREVVKTLFGADRIRLYCLYDGDEIVAVYYCYKFKDEISYFQSGFDPRHGQLSPGLLTLAYAIEQAIGEGCKTFDLLKGDYGFKRLWSNAHRQTAHAIVFTHTRVGWLARICWDYWPNVKNFLKRLVGIPRA